jgi:hypothetical protein
MYLRKMYSLFPAVMLVSLIFKEELINYAAK